MRFLIHRPLPSTTCKNMEKLGLMLGLVRWSLGQCRALQGAHKSLQHLSLPSRPCTRALSSPSLRQAPPTGLSPTARHPLQGEEPRQFLTADKETIVCVHPSLPVDFSTTKPLHPFKPELAMRRKKLDPDEEKFVQQLRSEDPSLWSVATLARLFNVKRVTISRVAPSSKEHQAELAKERKVLSRVKSYKRKIILAEKQMKRQKRLEEAIKKNDYKFPHMQQSKLN